MAVLTVRNLPDEVHRALRERAAEHGLSIPRSPWNSNDRSRYQCGV